MFRLHGLKFSKASMGYTYIISYVERPPVIPNQRPPCLVKIIQKLPVCKDRFTIPLSLGDPLCRKMSGDKHGSLPCQQKLRRFRAHLPHSSAKVSTDFEEQPQAVTI